MTALVAIDPTGAAFQLLSDLSREELEDQYPGYTFEPTSPLYDRIDIMPEEIILITVGFEFDADELTRSCDMRPSVQSGQGRSVIVIGNPPSA